MSDSQEPVCCSAREEVGSPQGGRRKGYAPLRHPAGSARGRPQDRPKSRERCLHLRARRSHSRARLPRGHAPAAGWIAPLAQGRRLRSKRLRKLSAGRRLRSYTSGCSVLPRAVRPETAYRHRTQRRLRASHQQDTRSHPVLAILHSRSPPYAEPQGPLLTQNFSDLSHG